MSKLMLFLLTVPFQSESLRRAKNRLMRTQQTLGRAFPMVSFMYTPVECLFYKFYGINCRPKSSAKLLDRFFHRRRQVSPVVKYLTHCFFDGYYHLLDGNLAVSFQHGLAVAGCSRSDGSNSSIVLPAYSSARRCQTRAVSKRTVRSSPGGIVLATAKHCLASRRVSSFGMNALPRQRIQRARVPRVPLSADKRPLHCGISVPSMSALGHKRTSRRPQAMSACSRKRTSTDARGMSASCH